MSLHDAYAEALRTTFLPRYGGEVLYAGEGSTAWWPRRARTGTPSAGALPLARGVQPMVADPDYQEVTALRTRALTEAVLQATIPWQ